MDIKINNPLETMIGYVIAVNQGRGIVASSKQFRDVPFIVSQYCALLNLTNFSDLRLLYLYKAKRFYKRPRCYQLFDPFRNEEVWLMGISNIIEEIY